MNIRHCTACGREIGGGKLGMASHWGKHYRDFFKAFGRRASSPDEIRAYFNGNLGHFK
jgi:hypothetical protein